MHEQYHDCHPLGRRVRVPSNTVSRPFGNTSRLMTKCASRIKFYYRPQTKLRKGNVFTPVCQSFCSWGCLPSACWDTPPWQTPPGRHPPGRHTPLGRHPPWKHTSPPGSTPPNGHCSGRYASYWNAFLFISLFPPKIQIQSKLSLSIIYFLEIMSRARAKYCDLEF